MTAVIILLLVIFCVGLGFLIGYRFIVRQTQKFDEYDRAMALAAEQHPGDQTEDSPVSGTGSTAAAGPVKKEEPELKPITKDTPGAVMIYIEMGDKPSDIAEKLADKGLISSPFLFNLISKMNGFDGTYQYGTHFVLKNMDYDQLMYTLTRHPATVPLTLQEGLTYSEMKTKLTEAGILFDEEKLDELVARPAEFAGEEFFAAIPSGEERDWPLQGYLFPDTYYLDMQTNEKELLWRLLQNLLNKLQPQHYEQAERLGMTMDEVITLASIIQQESGLASDMYKVSRVFHNRLERGDKLQSCATINYLRKERGQQPTFIVSEEDMAIESPYNTYNHAGLPPGPICSPGMDAINAALYPDEEMPNIYYFVARGDGTNYFSSSLAEHERSIKEYLVPQQEEAQQ